jgi:hypothetical protein
MRGERIVIPEKLQKQMIQIAHEGHQGIVRTKQQPGTQGLTYGKDPGWAGHVTLQK